MQIYSALQDTKWKQRINSGIDDDFAQPAARSRFLHATKAQIASGLIVRSNIQHGVSG